MAPALAGALGAAALAATAGLAALCFVTMGGLALLGRARTEGAATAREAGRAMWAPVSALGAGCVALGVVPGLLLPSPRRLRSAAPSRREGPGIAVPGTSLPALGLGAGPGGGRGGADGAARPPSGGGDAGVGLRAVRGPVARVDLGGLHHARAPGAVGRAARAPRRRHLVSAHVYAPAVRVAMAGAARARRLQSGNLRLYVGYLVGLVVGLLLLARAGALG